MTARILIVEDDPACADGLREALDGGGYQSLVAGDPAQAIASIGRDERIGVAVLDLGLPEIDGVRLLARLRAAAGERGKSLQALLCSGSAKSADLDGAMRSGISAFLAKPIDRADLLNAVGAAARRFAQLERDRVARNGLIDQCRRLEGTLADVTREIAGLTNVPLAHAETMLPSLDTMPAPNLGRAWEALQCRRLMREAQFLDALLVRIKIDGIEWRMLLALHEAEAMERATSATSIALASGTSETAGLRRLAALESRGLMKRISDPNDARRTLVNLTDRGREFCRDAIASVAASRAAA